MPPPVSQLQFVAPPLPPESALHEQITAPLPEPAYLPDKRQSRNRIVPILLLASCLFFLLATSILAFILLDKGPVVSTHPVLIANPGVLRVHDSFLLTGSAFQASGPVNLTRDVDVPIKDSAGKPVNVHTDKRGNFAVQITITANWDIGTHSISANDNMHPSVATTITVQPTPPTPPKLQLPTSPIDLGTNVPGAISYKTITLTNTGGGQIDWQAGSDSSWLTISPIRGTFSGSAIATLTVKRGNLAPQAYTGYIDFFQKGTYKALPLKVTMAVSPLAATLTVSPPPATVTVGPLPVPAMVVKSNTLAFSTIQGTNPAPQTFTITNTGNAPLNWAITEDGNAAAFAPVSSNRGSLAPDTSAVITVKPNVAASTASPIIGHITISDTDKGTPVQSQQVTVTITISNQAVISVSTTSLTFNSTSTIEAPAQLLTITNTGSAPLNWTLSQPLPSWLSVDIPGGALPPKATAFVNVASNSAGLSPGTYTYTLVVSDTDANTPATPQKIQVTLTVT